MLEQKELHITYNICHTYTEYQVKKTKQKYFDREIKWFVNCAKR